MGFVGLDRLPGLAAVDGPQDGAGPTDRPTVLRVEEEETFERLVRAVFCFSQVRPPSAVWMTCRSCPDAAFVPDERTSISFSVMPEGRGAQVFPASSLPSTRPTSPTAIPRFASRKAMARRGCFAPVFREAHLTPPSVVTQRRPCSQRTYAVVPAGAAASRSQQEPSANIGRIETAPSADQPRNRTKKRISICSYKEAKGYRVRSIKDGRLRFAGTQGVVAGIVAGEKQTL